ncbi:HutD family protein [Paeniroseomonas aquatica]|uniref:HutD family protein n=1 Tax=Paeniroseomonas aquatica TaxID=373043 RepID=A0ABT8AAW0_9PROT|nr:HutD family protein [Paeniroseomonas aquatica]MDN3566947.1 HutD family protein [Paeniroseomonas aquatica]
MLLRHAELPVSPWRNGAGRKADIAGGPGWFLGFAWLDAAAEFSDYQGQDRTITLLRGHGFALDFAEGPPLLVDQPLVPSAFDGGRACRCRLLDGPCLVVNAISDRARVRHAVEIRAPRSGDTGFAVLLSGGAILPDGTLAQPLDTISLPLAIDAVTCAVFHFTPIA